jgi:hypothetical protein
MSSRSAAASFAGIERITTAVLLRHGHHQVVLSFRATA